MKIGLKQIGVSLLSALAMLDASAGPAGNGLEVRDFSQFFFFQRTAVDRGDQRNGQQMQGQGERRQDREFGTPDNGASGNRGESPSNNSSEASRKQGRMTPEERRALRRQIDEAGHDIYRKR